MKNKILKKVVAILIIAMIISTDFFILGTNLISYAINLDSTTNNENIEFSTYFKNEDGEKVDKLTRSIKEEIKLYVEIKVKNEGYFNGAIEILNSNFKLKDVVETNDIASIEGNKINLKQINAGNTIELELNVEPIILDNITQDMLIKSSTVKLTGTYMETTYKGIEINSEKIVNLNLKPDENINSELDTDIITNKIFSVNGVNKRVVQVLIKSRLSENAYPIRQTTLNISIPKFGEDIPEEIKVFSLGTKATNGQETANIENWENEESNIKITLKNDANENNEIAWKKNAYDEIVVTFIYAENVDATKVETKTTSEILVYNFENKYMVEHTKGIENKEPNNIIMNQLNSLTSDIYKGQIYANLTAEEKKNIEFKTETVVKVTNTDIIDKIVIKEGKDTFVTDKKELQANTKYMKTEINKANMINLLGQDGYIEIKTSNSTYKITKDSETNENGNIIIDYENGEDVLEITTTKPIKTGILKIQHIKAIGENDYTRAELRTIKSLKTISTLSGVLGEEKIIESITEVSNELKETISKAELTINKENLSTMNTNQEVALGIKLITNGEKYDLYKNPTITIQLPTSVEDINVKSIDKLYGDEFDIQATYNKNKKTIDIKLTGEQISYPETPATQLYIQINLDITLSKMQPSKMDKITMTYTNENAMMFDGNTTNNGIVENNIKISSPDGLLTMNNNKTYNISGISGIDDNQKFVQLSNEDAGKDVNFEVALINNTDTNLNNIRILGNLPTDGIKVNEIENSNTLTTTLKEIIAPNATVYYSENVNATSDIADEANGWTTNLSNLTNVKKYLIILSELQKENSYVSSYTVQLPKTLNKDLMSYTNYEVIYDTQVEKDIKVNSLITGLVTLTEVNMEVNLSAEIGDNQLVNGDNIKKGEVIKYTATVKNTGKYTLKNVQLKTNIAEGTVYVEPEESFASTGASYYKEDPNVTEILKNIEQLESGETYQVQYEVRVKQDTEKGKEIKNKAIAICSDTTIESKEILGKVEDAKVRITAKPMISEGTILDPGSEIRYLVFVENLSNENIKNVEIQLNANNLELTYMFNNEEEYDKVPERIIISEIPANGIGYYFIGANIPNNVESISFSAIAKDANNNIYRSNKLENTLAKVGAKISLSSPQDNAYIKQSEEVEYNVTVENTGEYSENITVIGTISEYLEIESMAVDGNVILQTTDSTNEDTYTSKISNDISNILMVPKGSKSILTIKARVKPITEIIEAKSITTKMEAKIYGVVKATSEEVTHILKNSIEDIENIISGVAWLDANMDGKRDDNESILSGIKVKIYDVSKNNYLTDQNGKIIETTTNDKGEYIFTRINKGTYIILFEYDMENYEPTIYLKDGVEESKNSNAILKEIDINGERKTYAVTDQIQLEGNKFNINLGLREKIIYDLELNKYISKIVIQNKKGTKSYNYENSTFEKIEINPKELKDTMVILEYTIKVKNAGEIAGYASSIVDYLPNELTFSSELNPDWYLSGSDLYTKKFESEKINPGEEKEIKLILTKKMTSDNVGLINNRAEIAKSYNEYGYSDIDSKENNKVKGEDDLGSADVIISIKTGGAILYSIIILINAVLIVIAIRLMIKNNIIKIKRKKERR